MAKRLFMITKNFPYGSGESFIESEIQVAAKKFEEIIILVYRANLKEKERIVPKNVKVIPLCDWSKYKKICFYIKLIPSLFSKELREELKKHKTMFEKRRSLSFHLETLLKEHQAVLKIREIFQQEDFIIYSYWFSDTVYLAYRLLKRFDLLGKRIFVSRAHGYDLYKERNNGEEFPFRKRIFENISKVYPCSEQGEKYLQKEYQQFSCKIEKKYLGVMIISISDKKKKEKFHIVTCSNIIPLKRVIRLAEALKIIQEENPEITKQIQWTCFGSGSSEEELKEFCHKYLSSIKIQFRGNVKNEEVLRFYETTNVDLFVNLSTTEGLPVSIMEAMAHRIPAIATEVGGTPEIVIDGTNGVLLSSDFSNEQLVNAIKKIYFLDVKHKEKINENAYETSRKYFDAEKNYNDFYDEILNLN